MMKHIFAIACIALSMTLFAQRQDVTPAVGESLAKRIESQNCDTLVNMKGYSVHIVKRNGKLRHAGLNLFPNELKRSMDRKMMERIESELLERAGNPDIGEADRLMIYGGTIEDFKKIDPTLPSTVSNRKGEEYVAEWELDGRIVKVTLPIGYDVVQKGSRGDIETRFIEKIKNHNGVRRDGPDINPDDLEAYGEEKFALPGPTYQSKYILSSIYFNDDVECEPIWDLSFPTESVANMFIYPSDVYGEHDLTMTVLKHEYGEKEVVKVKLNQLLGAAEEEGCIPFWGIERFENGKLEGALFLYNKAHGYDHVFKIDCVPADLLAGKGEIKARASLYVPTNNVDNLFEKYKKKTEKERIKYDK